MAAEMAKRNTQLETFDAADPNRKMTLEESPWLQEAKGGERRRRSTLINVLDPEIAAPTATGAGQAAQGADCRSAPSPGSPAGRPRRT